MELKIERKWKKDTYTIGNLYINGKFFGNTLEDKDRGLKQTDSIATIMKIKVYGETAIPTGRYEIDMHNYSPKFGASSWYKSVCKGYVPLIKNVPGFVGVRIHTGNTALDSWACPLVGKNSIKGQLTQSKEYFKKIYKEMQKADEAGEKIYITIE